MMSSPLTSADGDSTEAPAYDAAGAASRARLETAYSELAAARDALEQRRLTEFQLRVDMAERQAEAFQRQADNLRAARDRLLGRIEALKQANADLRRNLHTVQAALADRAEGRLDPPPAAGPDMAADHAGGAAAAPAVPEAYEGARPFLWRIRQLWRHGRSGEGDGS